MTPPPPRLGGSWPRRQAARSWRGTGLNLHLPPPIELENMVGFNMLAPSKCTFVDERGRQHELDPDAVDAAYTDPLGESGAGIRRV